MCRSEEHTSELQSHSDLVSPYTLPSFPTRRSSDLPGSAWSSPRAPPSTTSKARTSTSRPSSWRRKPPASSARRPAGCAPRRARPGRAPPPRRARSSPACADRKSTRLNSSHTVISYPPTLYPLSLHDALPIYLDPHGRPRGRRRRLLRRRERRRAARLVGVESRLLRALDGRPAALLDELDQVAHHHPGGRVLRQHVQIGRAHV